MLRTAWGRRRELQTDKKLNLKLRTENIKHGESRARLGNGDNFLFVNGILYTSQIKLCDVKLCKGLYRGV